MNYYSFFGKEKTFQFFINNDLSYKLKGHLFCKTKKLANMNDSLLAFTDGTIIKINQIKGIKIPAGNFRWWIVTAGFLFPILDIGNNTINSTNPIVNERALIIGGTLIATGLAIGYIADKHIRIRKNTTFRVFDPDYEHLNAKK